MYELIDPEFVTSQKITSILRNAYIDIKETKDIPDSNKFEWSIVLSPDADTLRVVLDTKKQRFGIWTGTVVGDYNEFKTNEFSILNLINKMNEDLLFRCHIDGQEDLDRYVFLANIDYRYDKGFNPAQFIEECRYFHRSWPLILEYLTTKFKEEGIW